MIDHIIKYWDKQANKHSNSHCASWGDSYAIKLEVELIENYLSEGDDVLDVGCANGHATLSHFDKNIKSIVGIDASKKMIENAKERYSQFNDIKCNVSFEVGDVRKLRFSDGQFDIVYTTRVLINLATWEEQILGISECIRVCKLGGTIIFSESFWEPLVLLNAMRALKQLPPLVEHDFNRYLKKGRLEKHLNSHNIKYEVVDFSSVYYLGSRFLRELVTNPNDYPGYSNPINKIFYEIERKYSGGGFGIQQAYVISK